MKTEDEKEAVAIMLEAAKDTEYLEDAMLLGYRALLKFRGATSEKPKNLYDWQHWYGESEHGPSLFSTQRVEVIARDGANMGIAPADEWRWTNLGEDSDIIAWRLVEDIPMEVPF